LIRQENWASAIGWVALVFCCANHIPGTAGFVPGRALTGRDFPIRFDCLIIIPLQRKQPDR